MAGVLAGAALVIPTAHAALQDWPSVYCFSTKEMRGSVRIHVHNMSIDGETLKADLTTEIRDDENSPYKDWVTQQKKGTAPNENNPDAICFWANDLSFPHGIYDPAYKSRPSATPTPTPPSDGRGRPSGRKPAIPPKSPNPSDPSGGIDD